MPDDKLATIHPIAKARVHRMAISVIWEGEADLPDLEIGSRCAQEILVVFREHGVPDAAVRVETGEHNHPHPAGMA